jgi:hypothetical protein
MLMSRKVCTGIHLHNLDEQIRSTYSLYSSKMAEHFCRHFIPRYSALPEAQKLTAKLRFFDTGQVCSDTDWVQYQREVAQGRRLRTKLLVVEGGCDAFQPFKRRVWSTWMMGYRLTCINWRLGNSSDFELVTAISEGASEGKAGQIVAALDAHLLKQLCPPTAADLERLAPAGELSSTRIHPACDLPKHLQFEHRRVSSLWCAYAGASPLRLRHPEALSSVDMWVPKEGGKPGEYKLEKVGVWVLLSGVQADAPQRQMLARGLAPTAERGCDECGILAKQGSWNTTKYLGYCVPCDADARHPDTGEFWGEVKAWATGTMVKGSNKRPIKQKEPVKTTKLTAHQMLQRDKIVEGKAAEALRKCKGCESSAKSQQDKVYMANGSKGQAEMAKVGISYWDMLLFHPVAVYHTTYLGPGKDCFKWWQVRVGSRPHRQSGPLVLPFDRPKDVKTILNARRAQVVLRNKPDCILVDFTQHLSMMSCSEMQLLFEVFVPYMVHDLVAFGVPKEAVIMMLLLRYGFMCFTRLISDTEAQYKQQLKMGTACCFAYGAIAEFVHREHPEGMNQFTFSWKLHKLQHLADQLLARGHTVQSSDLFVERMMRHEASTVCKCVCCFLEDSDKTAVYNLTCTSNIASVTTHTLATRAGTGRPRTHRMQSREPTRRTWPARPWRLS